MISATTTSLEPHPQTDHESYLPRIPTLLANQRRRFTEASVE